MSRKRVLVVGSAEKSGGGVTTVISLIKKMPVWEEHSCYWLGTQIQGSKYLKLWYIIKAYLFVFCCIWRYDIVHFHTVPSRSSLIIQMPVYLLAKLSRKKTITHLHVGNQLADYTHDRLFLWWLSCTDCVVLLAQCFKDIFKSLYPSITTRVEVIYNACDDVDSIPYEQHDKTIVFAGAFRPNKGGSTLIKAFTKMHEKYPDWKLQMLGSGFEEEMYKGLIKDNSLDTKVEMPGYLSGFALSNYYKKAGIYCLCSHHEGFPMVVLEAWSYGVPVITTPVGGLPDVIEEGKNVLTFEFDDVDTLAKQLSCLIENENMRKDMSEYSKVFAKGHFSLTQINSTIINLYKTI